MYGAETEHFIDREAEVETLVKLQQQNCGGKLYGVFENGMCYEYRPGKPLTIEMLCEPHINR